MSRRWVECRVCGEGFAPAPSNRTCAAWCASAGTAGTWSDGLPGCGMRCDKGRGKRPDVVRPPARGAASPFPDHLTSGCNVLGSCCSKQGRREQPPTRRWGLDPLAG